jgi:3-phosphoglycerate kinase
VHDGVGLEFTHVFSGGDVALKLLEGKLPPSVDRLVAED